MDGFRQSAFSDGMVTGLTPAGGAGGAEALSPSRSPVWWISMFRSLQTQNSLHCVPLKQLCLRALPFT